ncbi:hypothetical protein O5558_03345 [Escherichia coli]|nr:hypothetical protein [Escherichia coli]
MWHIASPAGRDGAPLGLNHLGLLAPGKQADIVLLSDARKVTVQQVPVKGEPIDAQTLQAEESARLAQSAPPYGNTIARQPVSASDFAPAIYASKTLSGH